MSFAQLFVPGGCNMEVAASTCESEANAAPSQWSLLFFVVRAMNAVRWQTLTGERRQSHKKASI